MTTFEELGLPDSILAAIKKVGFVTPTPIQAQAIPFALQGRDVLGSAQTGTGKTAAFGIPMIAKLIADPQSIGIVMTPTRELAAQVLSTLKPLLFGHRDIRTALLIGGEPMPKQYQQLKQTPRVIVGTPGRINDHLERKSLNLSKAHFLVLDEMDRMLDMGFGVQIDRILQYMPQQRQTLLFSATIPPEIARVANKYQNNPERVAVGSLITPTANIKQELMHMSEGDKYQQLLGQLHERKGSVIVFVKTKHGAKRMAEKLCREDFKADTIHGNLNQNKRDRVIQSFRDKKYRILVATDVAARGLDIPHIEHVINYDLPQCPEDYIHRIGRTARAGATGSAVAFITPSDGRLWHAIHRLMNPGDKSPMPRTNDRPQNRRSRSGGNGKFGGGKFEGNKRFGAKRFGGNKEERPFAGEKREERRFSSERAEPRRFDKEKSEPRRFDREKSEPRSFQDRKTDWSPLNDKKFEKKRADNRSGSFGKKNDDKRGSREWDRDAPRPNKRKSRRPGGNAGFRSEGRYRA